MFIFLLACFLLRLSSCLATARTDDHITPAYVRKYARHVDSGSDGTARRIQPRFLMADVGGILGPIRLSVYKNLGNHAANTFAVLDSAESLSPNGVADLALAGAIGHVSNTFSILSDQPTQSQPSHSSSGSQPSSASSSSSPPKSSSASNPSSASKPPSNPKHSSGSPSSPAPSPSPAEATASEPVSNNSTAPGVQRDSSGKPITVSTIPSNATGAPKLVRKKRFEGRGLKFLLSPSPAPAR